MTRPVSIDLAPHGRRALSGLLLCAGWLACGCQDTQPTQLVVLVDSNFEVPSQLVEVRAVVRGPGDRTASHRFPLSGPESLPLSFGVEPLGGDASRAVTIEVEGRNAADDAVAVRRAETGFIAGRRLLLPMHLARNCQRLTCRDDETCTERGCLPARIPPQELAAIVPGSELALPPPQFAQSTEDGGPADAGGSSITTTDGAAPDAGPGPADATPPPDGRVPDAQPTPDAAADGGTEVSRIECTDTTCTCTAGESCELTCAAACTTVCEASRCGVDAVGQFQLDATCSHGADCAVDARGSMSSRITCVDDSHCEVDCANSMGCRLACNGEGAECLLGCQGASGCRISACPQTPRDCGGDLHACGVDCP